MERHPDTLVIHDDASRVPEIERTATTRRSAETETEATTMIERLLRRAGRHATRAQHAEGNDSVGPTVARAVDVALEDLRRRIAVSSDGD